MKKVNKLFLAGLLVLIFQSGCVKLNTKPSGFVTAETYYKSRSDVEHALAAVYSTLHERPLYSGQNCLMSMFDAADQVWSSSTDSPAALNFTAADPYVSDLWQALYRGIERANILLARIDGANMDEGIRNIYKGETIFLRAYYYFLLVQNWGAVPLKIAPTAGPDDIFQERTPANEVYDFIISEMTKSEAMVRPIEKMNQAEAVNQFAVRGMLARVNLYRAGVPNFTSPDAATPGYYTDALAWSEKIILNTAFPPILNPDYKQLFINMIQDKYDLKESFWEVGFYNKGNTDYYSAGELAGTQGVFNGINQTLLEYGYSGAGWRDQPMLWFLFEDNAQYKDVRKDWNFTTYQFFTNGVALAGPNKRDWSAAYPPATDKFYYSFRDIGKYRREYELVAGSLKIKNNTATNFPLMRYADVLLMAAEAENELNGPTTKAYNYLNQVRARAGASIRSGLAGKAALRKAIQDERYMELAFEGVRRIDLIRWGILVSRLKEMAAYVYAGPAAVGGLPPGVTGAWDARCATLGNNVSDKNIYLPIPSREISLNYKLTQNPGW